MQQGYKVEINMRRIVSSVILAGMAVVALAVQPAAAAVCLNVRSIKSSDVSKDGTSITFAMKDGKNLAQRFGGQLPGRLVQRLLLDTA